MDLSIFMEILVTILVLGGIIFGGFLFSILILSATIYMEIRGIKVVERIVRHIEQKTTPKAKIVRVPKGDEKIALDQISSNKKKGKSTPLSDIYG